ncbi:unnamed protein product [Owenia fusiformis]|uniref:Sodium/calcium exchanger membrane region domain-containing protein n=1 Tax=Owenia fusiformis TaxID=6347 RepID=A0A8S4PEQ6_OWEFU|nr:unnamed protein product [Owenia fusiformis]
MLRGKKRSRNLGIRILFITLLFGGLTLLKYNQDAGLSKDDASSQRVFLRKLRSTDETTSSSSGFPENGTASITNVSESAACTPPAYHEFPPDLFTLSQKSHGAIVLHTLVVIYMFAALAVVCDDYFVASLESICDKLHLSEDVAGATFMAAGSSAPELFTSVIGVFIAKGDVGVGTIVGSAVFNILFVIGICALLAGQAVVLTWFPLLRDSLFYSVSVITLIAVIYDGWVTWYESLIMLVFYVLYIVTMRFNTKIQAWCETNIPVPAPKAGDIADRTSILPTKEDTKYYGNYEVFKNEDEKGAAPVFDGRRCSIMPVDDYVAQKSRKLTWPEACFLMMMKKFFKPKTRFRSAVLLVISQRQSMLEDASYMKRYKYRHLSYLSTEISSYAEAVKGCLAQNDEDQAWDTWKKLPSKSDGVKNIVLWALAYPIKIVLYFTIPDCRKKRWEKWFMGTFIMAIIWIMGFSYIMVWMVVLIGFTLHIPDSIMGITFLAAGTSIPDAISSVIVAKQGQGDMAVSNTIGSNVFDVLVGLALPWFLKTGMVNAGSSVRINSNGLVVSVILLFLTVLITIGAINFTGWTLNRRLGIVCMVSYTIFLIFSILTEFNVFGYVNAPMCLE